MMGKRNHNEAAAASSNNSNSTRERIYACAGKGLQLRGDVGKTGENVVEAFNIALEHMRSSAEEREAS